MSKKIKATKENLALESARIEQEKQQLFINEYNALSAKYGYIIVPQMGIVIQKKQQS